MGHGKPQNEKLMRVDNTGQMQKAFKQIHLLDKQKYNSSNLNSNSMQIINSAPPKQQMVQQWPLNDIYLPNQMNGNLMPKDLKETDLKSLFKDKSNKKPLPVNSYNSLVLMF